MQENNQQNPDTQPKGHSMTGSETTNYPATGTLAAVPTGAENEVRSRECASMARVTRRMC